MDARITKPRLSNLLSYDWLKILVAVAIAVAALSVFFTSVKTRPADEQTFTVYAYNDVRPGTDAGALSDDLMEKDVFSYEILLTQVENFSLVAGTNGLYSGSIYATRLVNDARTVMFVCKLDDAESESYSAVKQLIEVNGVSAAGARNGFLDFEEYLGDCESYLKGFFGDDWRNGALDETKANDCFYSRNSKDKRYRNDEQKAEGALSELERLEKLRRDYAVVSDSFQSGILSYATITVEDESDEEDGVPAGTYNCGVSLGKLSKLSRLYYTATETEEGSVYSAADVSMILFNTAALGDKTNDLRYETVSFLAYLVSEYGA